MDDEQIIALYFDRNETAIQQTHVKYGKLCFNISRNILQNGSDAEECVNDTYLGLWNAIPPARPQNLRAFVGKIARNLSLKRLEYNRAQKRLVYEPIEFSELEEILADDRVPEGMSEEELGRLISDFLEAEDIEARSVFMRKYWHFDSLEDIARRYGFTVGKIKTLLHRTRVRLKEYLKERGIDV